MSTFSDHQLLEEHILGSILAAAVGDAMGSATEQHQIDEIINQHNGLLSKLIPPKIDTFSYRGDNIPGYFTDDTSQMIALAEALITSGGKLTVKAWIEKLLDWSINSFYRDQMGPTTRPLLEAIAKGESISHIGVVGKSTRKLTSLGVTNGAAMRVAPAGLINPGNIEEAVSTAWISCQPTHDTQIAASGAGAIAAGVATALVPGSTIDTITKACLSGARLGEEIGSKEGRKVAGPSVYRRIEIALEEVNRSRSFEDALRKLESSVGNSVYTVESVPAAVGIFYAAGGDPLLCAIGGTNIGNDTDTVAAMACAIAGAMKGANSIPQEFADCVIHANKVDFKVLAYNLTEIALKRSQDLI
jgi:ADP-ribosylglycohydrolase